MFSSSTRVDSANAFELRQLREHCRQTNPQARLVEAACRVSVPAPQTCAASALSSSRTVPRLPMAAMAYGAGVICARNCGVGANCRSRPFAVGSIRSTFEKYHHLSNVLPAMGYSEVSATNCRRPLLRVPCDVVVIATQSNLSRIIAIAKPSVRVKYELEEVTYPGLSAILDEI